METDQMSPLKSLSYTTREAGSESTVTQRCVVAVRGRTASPYAISVSAFLSNKEGERVLSRERDDLG